MKRIKAACLEQTIHFMLKEDLPHDEAVQFVKAEYEHYLAQLERNRTQYRILEKTEQPEGWAEILLVNLDSGLDSGVV